MVAKLITKSTRGETGEYLLTTQTVTIGRNSKNDVHADDISVSGKHAQIITILEDSFLEDLGSTNGTYVNGKLVKKHALADGDTIKLGRYEMAYHSGSATADPDIDRTMIIRPGAAGMPEEAGGKEIDESMQKISAAIASESKAADPAASQHSGKEGSLRLLNGTNAGQELKLTKTLSTIGQPGVQVAAVTRRPNGFFLIGVDGGPDNLTPKVGGAPIGTRAYQLKSHDIIEITGVKMEFFLR